MTEPLRSFIKYAILPNSQLNASLTFCLYPRRLEPQSQFRLAIGSYIEQYNNSVQILKTRMALPPGGEYPTMQIYSACEIEHPYPCTKILWSPDGGKTGNYGGKDLLATTGDYLRLWSVEEDSGGEGKMSSKREALLNNVS